MAELVVVMVPVVTVLLLQPVFVVASPQVRRERCWIERSALLQRHSANRCNWMRFGKLICRLEGADDDDGDDDCSCKWREEKCCPNDCPTRLQRMLRFAWSKSACKSRPERLSDVGGCFLLLLVVAPCWLFLTDAATVATFLLLTEKSLVQHVPQESVSVVAMLGSERQLKKQMKQNVDQVKMKVFPTFWKCELK